jgi:cytidine deaminase
MITDRDLVRAAQKARRNAYAPYSRFRVGAAVLTDSGRVFLGANVENASYGLTVCAERVAVLSAVSAGERGIVALAIAGSGQRWCYPCGACRQVIAEFGPRARVLVVNGKGKTRRHPLPSLLPRAFRT